jgi:nucleotide-binding universal stress UspA family protein
MDERASTYRRVVVAYDGSDSAEDALALALLLRDPSGGAMLLACVVHGGAWHLPGHRHGADEATGAAQEMLADVRTRLPAGIPVILSTPPAPSPARGLTELAEAKGADLIVVGSAKGATDGRIGLARTAGRLLQGAPCAVAVAPPGLRATGPFRHVGVAVDASAEAAAALRVAYAIARGAGSAMTLYSALDALTEPDAENVQHARLAVQERLDAAAELAPPAVNPATVFVHGPAGQVIADACDGVVDLLVTGSRAYGPLQRALLGSVSEELIARARHPVLVVPRAHPPLHAGTDDLGDTAIPDGTAMRPIALPTSGAPT